MFYYLQKKTYATLNSFQTNFYFFQSPPLISMSIEKPEKKIFFTEKEKQILFTHKHTHTKTRISNPHIFPCMTNLCNLRGSNWLQPYISYEILK